MDNQLTDALRRISQLEKALSSFSSEFYRNNFSGRQDFTKYANFATALKLPHYASDPTTCSVGEIIEVGGKLKICSATNTWTIVGTQS